MKTLCRLAILAILTGAACVGWAQWTWQGAWSGATAYTANQVVSYLGSSYLCLVGNTNVAPPTSATDWALIAQAGAAGAAGSPASVSIGSTFAGPPLSYPSVTNTGSGSAAVLNFTIPQSWFLGQNYVATLNGTGWAFTINGSCLSVVGTTYTFSCPSLFSAITSGTNTGAVMLVGTGASLSPTGSGTVSANQINGVPLCSGFSPTDGQALQYTTGGTPNPCYSSGTSMGAYKGLARVSFTSCTLADDGGEGSGCTGSQAWGVTISGSYYWWCNAGPYASGTLSEQGRFVVNRISETASTFTYIIDNMQSASRGSTLPMVCWATN